MIKLQGNEFPLSKKNSIRGSRRLVREKVLQILLAYQVSEIPWTVIFDYVFFREYRFDEEFSPEVEDPNNIYTPEEVSELEADIPISWPSSEVAFAKELIEKVIEYQFVLDKIIVSITENWDVERISLIDHILIRIAGTELMDFPDVPARVSINEVIEISKNYSTDKSAMFINGLLEKLYFELKAQGRTTKEV